MRIAYKKVGEELKVVNTTERYRGECAEKIIGCELAQGVWLDDKHTLSIMVDEEGLRKDLKTNFLMAFTSEDFPIQKMVGTVVFIRTKPVPPFGEIYDYEIDDLTDNDIEVIEKFILSEEHQDELSKKFKDYGRGYTVFRPIVW